MSIEFNPHVRQGECCKCGKRFIRRTLGPYDDGRLCTDCYIEDRETKMPPVHNRELPYEVGE